MFNKGSGKRLEADQINSWEISKGQKQQILTKKPLESYPNTQNVVYCFHSGSSRGPSHIYKQKGSELFICKTRYNGGLRWRKTGNLPIGKAGTEHNIQHKLWYSLLRIKYLPQCIAQHRRQTHGLLADLQTVDSKSAHNVFMPVTFETYKTQREPHLHKSNATLSRYAVFAEIEGLSSRLGSNVNTP